MRLRVLASGSTAMLCGLFFVVSNETRAQGVDDLSLEEVVVTARKKEESLQEIPIAINAFTADDIARAAITGLEDISTLASGFYFFNQGQSQPGRYNTQLRFRGLNQAQFSPSFETGALFVDGVYVLNGGTSLSLMDVERVEVIKGPQSAYFGRNTFGGAVNFITKNPNLEEVAGTVDFSGSDRGTYDLNGFVEGPLIPGSLSASLGVRYYDKEGQYTASDGGSLGDEQTQTVNAKVFWAPSEDLSFSFRASYSEDQDGAPATAYIAGQVDANDSCTGRTVTTTAGEQVNPISYVCGQVPGVNSGTPVMGSRLIDGNTIIPSFAFDDLVEGPRPNGAPFVDDIGMKRETLRLSASATWDLANDYTIDAIAGYNDQAANWIRDFDLSGFSNAYSNDPQGLEDTSFEVRLTSPQDQRLRWSLGANYYEQEFVSSGAGGNFVFACFGTGNPAAPCVPNLALNFPNSFTNTDESEVTGLFGSIDFDLTDQWTATLEGRFQEDELNKGGGANVDGLAGNPFQVKNEEFLPRVILRYQPSDATNLYVSYAKGVVPGDVNQQFVNADERERPQYLAAFPGLAENTPQEELNAIELGIKQQLWDGRAYVNFAYYQNEWTGIKGRSSVSVNETCDASGGNALGVPGCDFEGVQVGDGKMIVDPATGELILLLNARNILIDGDADIQGFELEFGGLINDRWSADIALAYVDTEYTRYQFNFVQRIAGFADMRGNSTPRTPEWSGNLTSTYTWPMNNGMEGFFRGDVIYMGEVFTDETNLAFLEDYFLANVRGGVETDRYRVELFIKNLFDEDAWATGARFSDTAFPTDFSNFFVQQGFNLTPQNKREAGIRATYRF